MRNAFRPFVLLAIAVSLSTISATNAQQNKAADQASNTPDQEIPPYHKSAQDAQPLPQTLSPSQFSNPLVAEAYEIASEIPVVLAQQPCYCHCNREFGHTSLLDCFTSTHTAGCGICMGETFFAYRMTKQGKTPAEIREGIIRGDWKQAAPVEK
jgi:hypothetical protein